jgi:hypothetical protein
VDRSQVGARGPSRGLFAFIGVGRGLERAGNAAGSIPPSVPEFPSPTEWGEHNAQIGMRDPEALPPWFGAAWKRLADSSSTDAVPSALTSWHQGVLMRPQHASFALVAFVAAIEALATTSELRDDIGPTQDGCPKCGNIPQATQRFWAAVELVGSEADVAALRDANVYSLRSRTGHSAVTHGFEARFGARLSVPLTGADEAFRFVTDTLGTIARVGRSLLLHILISEDSATVPRL